MFASPGCGYYIKFVEPDDSVDRAAAGDICDCADVIFDAGVVLDGTNFVDRGPEPGFVEKFFARYEGNVPLGGMAFIEELVALVFACDADDPFCHLLAKIGVEAPVARTF